MRDGQDNHEFWYVQWNPGKTKSKELGKSVRYNGGLLYRVSLPYILLLLGWRISFVIPRSSLYRGLRYTEVFVIPRYSLYRGLRYTEVFVILRSSLYRGLRYTGVFVLPGSSLYRGLRYTGVFVIPRSSLDRGLRYTGVFVIPGSSLYRGLRYVGGPLYLTGRSSGLDFRSRSLTLHRERYRDGDTTFTFSCWKIFHSFAQYFQHSNINVVNPSSHEIF